MEIREPSLIGAMIQKNIEKLAEEEGLEVSHLQVFSATLEKQEETRDTLCAMLPADHPWFRISGVTPKAGNGAGNFMDVHRAQHHILSPGLRNWREDITEDEMEAAKDAELRYDATEETAATRRAKAEYRRRQFWSFKATFDQLEPVQDHDWKWRARLYA